MPSSFFNRVQINYLDSNSFEQKLKETPDAVLLDVRTEDEHSSKRIPNSILINMYEPGFLNQLNEMDKSKSYFVYCHSGGRSGAVCELMLKNGFEKVFNLEDGIINWQGEVEQG